MKSLNVTQKDKSTLKFSVGQTYALKHTLLATYLTVNEPMRVEHISKDTIRFIDPVSGSGTYERISKLDCMIFEKVA